MVGWPWPLADPAPVSRLGVCGSKAIETISLLQLAYSRKLPQVPETLLKRRKERAERKRQELKQRLADKKVNIYTNCLDYCSVGKSCVFWDTILC